MWLVCHDSTGHIVFPNANYFKPDHQAHWEVFAPKKNRLYADFRYACYATPCHEIHHIIQQSLHQNDQTSWILEHDASRLQFVTLSALGRGALIVNEVAMSSGQIPDDPLFELLIHLPPGKVEEIILYYHRIVRRLRRRITPEQEKQYERWRDSFGYESPDDGKDAFSTSAEEYHVSYYFKLRLALEAYVSRQGANMVNLMEYCFQNRANCDLHEKKPQPSEDLVIIDDHILNSISLPAGQGPLMREAQQLWELLIGNLPVRKDPHVSMGELSAMYYKRKLLIPFLGVSLQVVLSVLRTLIYR